MPHPPLTAHYPWEIVGKTPLVRLHALETTGKGQIWAKLESRNPGGSIKDRIALSMLQAAEEQGLLPPGSRIIEPTSGNTGIGLALMARARSYTLELVMPENMSLERRRLLQAYGATIQLTAAAEGMQGAVTQAQKRAAEHGAYMPAQFNNPANPGAHKQTTGPEITAALDSPTAFVAAVGTGGTLTGVGRHLQQHSPQTRIVAVEPAESAVLSGGQPGPHGIQGIGAGFIPAILDTRLLQQVIPIDTSTALHWARHLARETGFLGGISAGANLAAAHQVAAQMNPAEQVVTIICDTGERYLSTELFASTEA